MAKNKHKTCTCYRHCKGGKEVPPRTYYNHGPQRELEAKMTAAERESQTTRIFSKRRRRPQQEAAHHEEIPDVNEAPVDCSPPGSPNQQPEVTLEDKELAGNLQELDLGDREPSPVLPGEGWEEGEIEERDAGNRDERNNGNNAGNNNGDDDEIHVNLDDLKNIIRIIQLIHDYDFGDEKAQWTEAHWLSFTNPSSEIPELLNDKTFLYSLELYLSLAERCSRETYEKQRAINQKYHGIDSLSHYQVKSRLETLTGIIPILHDMCVNSCMAFTAIYVHLLTCIYCGEDRYEDTDHTKPRRQFETIPLGPQIQALWRHAASVGQIRYRVTQTKKILEQRHSATGITIYDDVLCGTEYLDLVESGQIGENDIFLSISIDGAQIYRDKQSDAWFGIAVILDFPPELRHSKYAVPPLFVIGGPNPPKNYNSFLFPTLAHLSACQKNGGLPIWNAAESVHSTTIPWLAYGTADTVGITELNGWVGHHGKNGCRLLCGMPGRHKPNVGTYYPVMLRPHGDLPIGSIHDDIDINTIRPPTVEEYTERLRYVLSSENPREYEFRRRETGIRLPSLIAGVPKSLHPAKACPTDIMHLFLNVCTLLVSLLRGSIDHGRADTPENWPFAVLHDVDVWKNHGARVGAAGRYLPVCLEDRIPRNPAEKINSGYKACEYLVYVFGFCPALLYGLLPPLFYRHFCKLVAAVRMIHQYSITREDLVRAHELLTGFVYQFELLYVERKLERIHFIRPCIHALIHLIQEIIRLGCLFALAQWTLERTIGRFVGEMRSHSEPYANLGQRMLESARTNALNAMDPTILGLADKDTPSSLALDVGSHYMLLHPRKLSVLDPEIFDAFKIFSESQDWRFTQTSLSADIFARLLLPNGQIARSLWHEMKRPPEKVRPARNVKILLNGEVRYAEVVLFFIVDKENARYTMAAVRMYSPPDPDLLEYSFGTLSVCTFLGNEDIQIIDAKWIQEVVGMVPFHRNPDEDDTDEFFVVRRLRSFNTDIVNNSEEDEERSLLDNNE
ncbi:hypothetical protein V5O48_008812 [Marasmius crinis-equi]|uniref:Uncharacterized protein n=1 Tax=Marasmius crinis-equi TaxID=585013 RepID=A0ABR3FCV4_9AGAR